MSNFVQYPPKEWIEGVCQMSQHQALQVSSCSLLQCGCHHPNEQTYKVVAGFVLWATAPANPQPTSEESFQVLGDLKQMMAFERTRMQLQHHYYLSFPGPQEFKAAHANAYQQAFGDGVPAGGVPPVLAHRTPQLLFYITAGVPCRRSARVLRGTPAAAPAARGVGGGVQQADVMGQFMAAVLPMLQQAIGDNQAGAGRPARLKFLRPGVDGQAASAAAGAAQSMPALEVSLPNKFVL